MADQRYIDFLSKLISDTKEKKINWKYLDSNIELCKSMNWAEISTEINLITGSTEKVSMDFNREDSFYMHEKGTFVVVYVWGKQPAKLYVIPNTYKKIVTLTPNVYGEYITRLLNLVQSQFPNAETFIDSFIKSNN